MWLRIIAFLIALGGLGTARAELSTGIPAPRELGLDLAGNPLSLSDFPGQYVLVNFWMLECKPCRTELPLLEKFANKFGHDRLAIVAVNFRDEQVAIRKLLSTIQGQMHYTTDERGTVGQSYKLKGLPYSLLIDPNGKILTVSVGYDEKDLMRFLNRALALSRRQS